MFKIKKQWLIYSLPNVKHFILSNRKLLSIDSELAQFLNKRIQRLNIDFSSQFEQLADTTYIYLSNVEHIYLCFDYIWDNSQSCVNTFMKILKNFENLKTLTIYRWERYYYSKTPSRIGLDRMIKYLDINQIMKTYQVKRFLDYSLFSKRRYDNDLVQKDAHFLIPRRISFSPTKICCFNRKKEKDLQFKLIFCNKNDLFKMSKIVN
jgi:hypothetical protein